jgi:hypothetical protein
MPKRLPPLPKIVNSQLGPVEVRHVKNPKLKKRPVFGYLRPRRRRIYVDVSVPLVQQWHTLYHELVHLEFFDSGARNALSPGGEQEELLCDLFATMRMRELLNGL